MPFEKGRAKTGGKQKGTKNKLSREVAAKLEELGCDPIEGMVRIAKDKENTPELRGKMWAELAQYVYPKRKAVEHYGLPAHESSSQDQFREALMAAARDLPDEVRHQLAAKLLEIDKSNGSIQ